MVISLVNAQRLGLSLLAGLALSACHPSYSPNDYATNAVQQANKVDQAVVVGYRQIVIRPDGTTGTVTGGAAGGIVGGAAGSSGTMTTALGAVGGTLVGGLIGGGVEKATGNVEAFEYIVRKPDGGLLSVVQVDTTPLNIGQRVLLIGGNQARIVPDYTVTIAQPTPPPKAQAAATPSPPVVTAAPVAPAAATTAAAPAPATGEAAADTSQPPAPSQEPAPVPQETAPPAPAAGTTPQGSTQGSGTAPAE